MNDELIVRAKGGVVEVEANKAIAGGLLWDVVKKEGEDEYILQRAVKMCPSHSGSPMLHIHMNGTLGYYCEACERRFMAQRKSAKDLRLSLPISIPELPQALNTLPKT